MMYILYRRHHKLPSEYFNLGQGEKKILRAFVEYETEQIKEENRG